MTQESLPTAWGIRIHEMHILNINSQGEAQRVERLVEAFAQRYIEANPAVARKLENPDSIFVLAFAIIMLNTDAHSPSMRKEKRMTETDFINNLRGIDNGKDLDKQMLANVYNRVTTKEYKAQDDHINQVFPLNFINQPCFTIYIFDSRCSLSNKE